MKDLSVLVFAWRVARWAGFLLSSARVSVVVDDALRRRTLATGRPSKDETCAVCMDRPAGFGPKACVHRSFCRECLVDIERTEGKFDWRCPICRGLAGSEPSPDTTAVCVAVVATAVFRAASPGSFEPRVANAVAAAFAFACCK